MISMALAARYCFVRDEHYLIDEKGKVVIIDESTGRTMADRSWRSGLHQAIQVREGVKITSKEDNLARISFQRFFRQYKNLSGMTGTAWEAAAGDLADLSRAGRADSHEPPVHPGPAWPAVFCHDGREMGRGGKADLPSSTTR